MKSSFRVGKYLISPLIRRDRHGRYVASVSIRSGNSSMTHDRLMRFTPFLSPGRPKTKSAPLGGSKPTGSAQRGGPFFDSADEAERFATAEALGYIEARGSSMPRFS